LKTFCICIVIFDCVTADDERLTVSNATNGVRSYANKHLTADKTGLPEDQRKVSAAIESPDWNNVGSYSTSLENRSTVSAEQFNGSVENGHAAVTQQDRVNDSNKLHADSVTTSSAMTVGGSRQSSAMKLMGSVEPQSHPQEHVVPNSHTPSTPPTPLQSPTTIKEERKSAVTANRSSASPQSRRTLSNEPLGAEYDVKQIKVRRAGSNSTASNDPFDFFADMAPIIASSASEPHKSLLGILSPAAASAAIDVSSTELTSQLSINDQNSLDTSVSS